MNTTGQQGVEGFEVVECQTREEWLELRKGGIGASEAAVLVGAGRETLGDMWARKVGILPDSVEEHERLEWGRRLEPALAAAYEEKTGRLILDPGDFTIYRSRRYPWGACTLDREIAPIEDREGPGVLELKCVDSNRGSMSMSPDDGYRGLRDAAVSDWKDEPPLAYLVQLQWQLLVTGYQWGSFAVLVGGNKFLWLDVERRQDVIDILIAEAEKLWQMVAEETPPPIEYESSSAKDLLGAMYQKDDGTTIELPAAAIGWDARRTELKAQEKTVAAELEAIDNSLRAAIGEHTIGTLPDGSGRYRWQQVIKHVAAKDAYEQRFRELRRLAPLKGKGKP